MKKKSMSLFAILAIVVAAASAFTTKPTTAILVKANSARLATFNPLTQGTDVTTAEQSYPGSTQNDKADAYANGAGVGFPEHCIASSLTCFAVLLDNAVQFTRPGSFQ